MNNADETVRALRHCGSGADCSAECPYYPVEINKCGAMNTQAADLIESLQTQLSAERDKYAELKRYNVACTKQVGAMLAEKIDLKHQLARVTAERDAALEYVPHECGTCAHWITDEVCAVGSKENCFWKWRGARQDGEGGR